jgi:hypothetical protein
MRIEAMKARLFCLPGVLALLLASSAARAAEVCVGPAASGDGSGTDWNNMKAWTATPARGDTWYLADGSYPGKTFDVPASGTTPITIKKATASDHGPAAGWNDTMGDGQAAFTSAIQFDSPHWVFDGRTGGGPGHWNGDFGFKITSADDALANVRIGYDKTADDITVRHVDLQGKGSVSTQGGSYSNDAVAIYSSSDITVSYAWIHGAGRCPFYIDTANSVFEYVYVESYHGSGDVHSEVASIWNFGDLPIGDITFRHNLITHIVSTGGLMFDNSSNPSSHLYVYGNVFYKPAGDTWEEANGVIGGWTGGGGEEMHNVWVYNNSFINIDQSILSTLPKIASGSRAQNNLFYNSTAPSFDKFPTHDYNHFVSSGGTAGEANGTSADGDPFVDAAKLDFTLSANTAPGTNLGAPFDVDGLGHTRTTWTRGAYEYCDGKTCGTGGTGGAGGAGGAGTAGGGGKEGGADTPEQKAGCACRLSAGEREDLPSPLVLFASALGFARMRRRRALAARG